MNDRIPDLPIESLCLFNWVDCDSISHLTRLTDLCLIGHHISDFAPLQALSRLKGLISSYNRIYFDEDNDDAQVALYIPLLPSLEWLILPNQSTTFEFLTALTGLTSLSICSAPGVSYSPLTALQNLKRLGLLISDLDSDLPPLPITYLSVSFLTAASLDHLTNLTRLERLFDRVYLDLDNFEIPLSQSLIRSRLPSLKTISVNYETAEDRREGSVFDMSCL
jgi:hypothetical protein